MRKNVVLVGFMGTGKTQTAKCLSDILGMRYISLDEMIEKREGRTIRNIFAEDGEPYFRSVEKEAALEASKSEGSVIDTGGGIVLDGENMENLSATGLVICLWASPKVVYERTCRHGHRPLLNVPDPEGKIRELLEKRRQYYERAPHHVDTDGLTPAQVAEQIMGIIDEKTDKL